MAYTSPGGPGGFGDARSNLEVGNHPGTQGPGPDGTDYSDGSPWREGPRTDFGNGFTVTGRLEVGKTVTFMVTPKDYGPRDGALKGAAAALDGLMDAAGLKTVTKFEAGVAVAIGAETIKKGLLGRLNVARSKDDSLTVQIVTPGGNLTTLTKAKLILSIGTGSQGMSNQGVTRRCRASPTRSPLKAVSSSTGQRFET